MLGEGTGRERGEGEAEGTLWEREEGTGSERHSRGRGADLALLGELAGHLTESKPPHSKL